MAVYTFLEHTWLSFKEAEESIPSPPPGPDRSSGERISRVKRKRGLAVWWADNPHPPPPLLCVFSKMEKRCWECEMDITHFLLIRISARENRKERGAKHSEMVN
ncbi:hypothetical protein AOLI_G00250010 [Acnodon oligacanthus]